MNQVTVIKPADEADTFKGVTTREFMRMLEADVFDGRRAELIDGIVHKMAPAGIEHSVLNADVAAALRGSLSSLGLRVGVDMALVTDDLTLFGIDVAILKPGAPAKGAASGSDVSLAVEVADSTLSKDLGLKVERYATAGIHDYWVIDVKARVIRTMSNPEGGGYQTIGIVRFGEVLVVPGTNETITIG